MVHPRLTCNRAQSKRGRSSSRIHSRARLFAHEIICVCNYFSLEHRRPREQRIKIRAFEPHDDRGTGNRNHAVVEPPVEATDRPRSEQ